MNNGDGLQELIQCERQAELAPKRVDYGWNRLAARSKCILEPT